MKEGARSSEIERASDGGKGVGETETERASERARERERGSVTFNPSYFSR